MPKTFAVLFYFSLLLSSCVVCAQQLPTSFRFNKYTIENGLSDNHIGYVLKDKKGFLWISTQNGISRFDGVEFKNFRHNAKDTNSLLNNFTGITVEDSLGRIWITAYNGLSMYNPNNGKFWNFIPSEKEFVKTKVLWTVAAQDGSIWFSTWNKLNTIDLKTLKITSWLIDTAAPDKNNVSIGSFFEDHNGDFWFDSYKGVFIFNRHFHTVSLLKSHSGLSGLYDDGEGKAYFADWGSGLSEYDFATKKIIKYFLHNPKIPFSDSVRAITWISHINIPQLKNYIWVSSERELAVFDVKKKTYIRYYQFDQSKPNIFPEVWPGQTLYDGNNNFWLAARDGLYVASLDQLAVTTYYLPNATVGEVSRVREDYNDKSILWASINGRGIFKLDRSTGNILENFLPDKTVEYTDSNRNFVADFLQLNTGGLLLTGGSSLSYYNPANHEHYFIKLPSLSSSDNLLNGTYSLSPMSDSVCWISTSMGIGNFNIKKKSFSFYPHYDNSETQNYDEHYVRLMMKDYDGNIWFYNHNDGFFMYDPNTRKFNQIIINGIKLINLIARGITQTSDSSIWLSADDQLFYRKKGDTIFHTLNSPAINGFLFDMTADKKGNLYMLTVSSILKYNTETGKIIAFTTKDGLVSNSNSGLDITSDGKIFLKGIGYFCELNPEKFRDDYPSSPLIFEAVSINGKDTAIDFDNYKTKPLHLFYTQNQFSIHFRLMNFLDPAQTNYYYKLDGWDKEWVSSNTGNYASYSNLPGGNYTLHVKAINPDGTENLQQAILLIYIDTPFWNTWWFTALWVISFCGVIYFIYRLRMERKKAVENIRSKISRDLHDDVGSALTSINIWSDVAVNDLKNNNGNSAEYISRIHNTSQNTLDNMNDIIWAINPKNDTVEKVLLRMKSYASEILEPKEINFSFNTGETIIGTVIPMQYRREWYLIFKEAINNAAKYSGAKNIFVDIQLQQNYLVMIIKDDGKGFTTSEKKSGNGLANMKERAAQIHAIFEINSTPGKGTEILLKQKFT